MPVERDQYDRVYDDFPHLRCPRCEVGRLTKFDQHVYVPPWAEELVADDPDFVQIGRITVAARCSNPRCKDIVLAIGTHSVPSQIVFDDQGDPAHEDVYEFHRMYPAPPMIRIPKGAPDPVREDLNNAFAEFWHDREGCIGKVRGAAEKLLDHYGVTRKRANGSFMPLVDRVALLNHPDVQENWLHALRVIGNAGTHDAVTDEAVFNAMDMIEIILAQAFEGPTVARADALAQLLNP